MDWLRRFPLPAALSALPPPEALRRLLRGERAFLLDGAAAADGLGRHSYAGCDPLRRFVVREVPELDGPPPWERSAEGHLLGADSVRAPAAPILRQVEAAVASAFPLVSVGLLGYELGRAIERVPRHAAPEDLGCAAVDLAGYDAVYRYDAETGAADVLAIDEAAAARLIERLRIEPPAVQRLRAGALRSETDEAAYGRRIERVLEYLRAGDCYQVNLCHWLRARLDRSSALALYLRLRQETPAPLGFFLQLDGEAGPTLLSNTPELLLRYDLESGVAETRPIKGTRRRDPDPRLDAALGAELLASRKDLAEHLMIVDLLRNDLGRIAAVGSVHVEGFARRLVLPTVHHLVSTVRAVPAGSVGLAELLHALLPGGSITGAPKLAAVRIIDELEPMRRGPFYGCVGWLGPGRGMLALNIRTAVAHAGELTLAVGGGLVLDSDAAAEWRETEAKAAAFRRALGA